MSEYVMQVYDYRFSEDDAVRARTYSSIHDLAHDLKQIANKYINEIAFGKGEKPDVCCYKIPHAGMANIDIYDGDECVAYCIYVIGIGC